MRLLLKRRFKGDAYTVGTLYVNGERFCDTLEDRVRDLAGGTWVATAIYGACGVLSVAALVRMFILVRRIKKDDCTAEE